MSDQAKKPSISQKISRWFREMRSEVKKIVWPTLPQVVNNSLVVVAVIIVVGILIWLVDFGFEALRNFLISLS